LLCRYEFTTPNGLHVAMAVAAQRGKVYVCGGSTSQDAWEGAKTRLRSATTSFRIRSAAAPL
jgi:hypothetical protein